MVLARSGLDRQERLVTVPTCPNVAVVAGGDEVRRITIQFVVIQVVNIKCSPLRPVLLFGLPAALADVPVAFPDCSPQLKCELRTIGECANPTLPRMVSWSKGNGQRCRSANIATVHAWCACLSMHGSRCQHSEWAGAPAAYQVNMWPCRTASFPCNQSCDGHSIFCTCEAKATAVNIARLDDHLGTTVLTSQHCPLCYSPSPGPVRTQPAAEFPRLLPVKPNPTFRTPATSKHVYIVPNLSMDHQGAVA